MPNFNVGDLVINDGKTQTYGITNTERPCMVVKNLGSGDKICVLVLTNDQYYGEVYDVLTKAFYQISTDDPRWNGVHPDVRSFVGDHIDPNDVIINGIPLAEDSESLENNGRYGDDIVFTFSALASVPSPLLFNKERTYSASDVSIDLSIKALKSVLDRYEVAEGVPYDYQQEYVEKVVRKNASAKQWWDAYASKLPNWNADYRYLDDRITLERETSSAEKEHFASFLEQAYIDIVLYNKRVPEVDLSDYYETREEYRKYIRIAEAMEDSQVKYDMKYKDLGFDDVVDKRDELYLTFQKLDNYKALPAFYTSGGENFRCSREDYRAMEKIRNIMAEIKRTNERLTGSNALNFNHYLPELKARADQKLSTIVLKFAQIYGLTGWTGKTETVSWTDASTGATMSKEKVDSWNARYTKFCDAIKPLKKDFRCIITSNISDFVTMSNGSSWASCMTLDKTNLDERSGNYEGCYSGGTIDYACDPSTIMLYLIPEDNTDEATWDVPKQKRCLFYVGETDFVQSRVYPDGRDGSEFPNIKKELLNKFIEVVTKMSETDLLSDGWTSKEYSSIRNIDRDPESLHYPDYNNYRDVTTIRNRAITRFKRIKVGAEVPCLCCGNTNDNENAVLCTTCCEGIDKDLMTCEECEACFNSDSWASVTGFDNYGGEHFFCSRDCAEEAGFRYCEDVDEYRDDYYQDDYEGKYYHNDDDKVDTEDGHSYCSVENAESAGYIYCDDIDGWLIMDKARYCKHCELWVSAENYDEEEEMCKDCLAEESEGE